MPGASALRRPPPPLVQGERTGVPPTLRLEPVDTESVDRMVLHYAVLSGALDLLPAGLAAIAVIPLQMRMVYRIGREYGFTLDRGHVREFLATVGVGLASQAADLVARRILGGLGADCFGNAGRSLAGAGTAGVFSFACTYAIGRLADRYYAGGRHMSRAVLRETYARLLDEGRRRFGEHAGAVRTRAGSLNSADVIDLVRRSP